MKTTLLLLITCLALFAEAQVKEYNLTNTDLETEDNFGSAVAVSNYFVAVGANGTENSTGSVLMYKGQGENWNLHSTLVPEDANEGDFVGMDIAMNEDYMVVGAPTDHWVDEQTGRAFVYEFNNDQWVESAVLQPSDSYYQSAFGFIVNIYKDQIMVGAPDHNYSNGALIIYEKDDAEEWVESHEFTNPDYEINAFGCAFDMNDHWMAIGAYQHSFDTLINGSRFIVQMYEKMGTQWEERQLIEYEYQSLPYQIPGYMIEMSNDQLLIGNHRASAPENIDGETKVYHLVDNKWEVIQSIHPDGFELNEIGRQVALGEKWAMIGSSIMPSNSSNTPHHMLIYDTADKEAWRLIGEFEYGGSSLLNWQGFNVDVNNQYGVASTFHKADQHGDVYIYDLRRYVNNQNIISDEEIKIYPIPSTVDVTIENEQDAITGYKVFSLTGQLVLSQDALNDHLVKLNVSTLTPGNYWVKVSTAEGHLYRQINKM